MVFYTGMEKNIDQPIQSLWIGDQLSKVEQLCIRSFIDHGHQFHLYTYGEIKNIPHGAKIFDANSIMPSDAIFRFENGWGKGSVAGFADIFRLQLLQKMGGWWVDMDVICLKPLDFAEDVVLCSSYETEFGSLPNNCVFKTPPNSPFIAFCLNQLAQSDFDKMSFGSAGPFLFQKAVRELKLQNTVLPYYYFNPISWRFISELVLGKMGAKNKMKELLRPILKPKTMPGRKIMPNSYTLHLWNEIWNAGNLDKNGRYHPGSLFEKLKRKHGIK